MAYSRKTVDVKWVLDRANALLKMDIFTQEQKKGITYLLTDVLHETNNYNGFFYHDPDDHTRDQDRTYNSP